MCVISGWRFERKFLLRAIGVGKILFSGELAWDYNGGSMKHDLDCGVLIASFSASSASLYPSGVESPSY